MKVNIGRMLKTVEAVWGELVVFTRPSTGEVWSLPALPSEEERTDSFLQSRVQSDTLTLDFTVDGSRPAPQKDDRLSFNGRQWIVKSIQTLDTQQKISTVECFPG